MKLVILPNYLPYSEKYLLAQYITLTMRLHSDFLFSFRKTHKNLNTAIDLCVNANIFVSLKETN